jgi:hypothetical protein
MPHSSTALAQVQINNVFHQCMCLFTMQYINVCVTLSPLLPRGKSAPLLSWIIPSPFMSPQTKTLMWLRHVDDNRHWKTWNK